MANRFRKVTNNTADADASDVNQYAEAFDGSPGEGKPLDLIQLDEDRFYVVIKNLNAGSKCLQILKNDGTVLLEVKSTGCLISPNGAAAGVPVTQGATQTLANKTLTAPVITGTIGRTGSHYDAVQVSTSSTSYVDSGSQVTITTTGGNLLVWFSCSPSSSSADPGTGQLGLKIDAGADIDLTKAEPPDANDYDAAGFVYRATGLAAGSHTLKVRMRLMSAGGNFRLEDRSLVVMEV